MRNGWRSRVVGANQELQVGRRPADSIVKKRTAKPGVRQ